jgi:hypothetical protein
MHIQILGHESHSPLLIIHLSKTGCSSSVEVFAVCADALSAENTHNSFVTQLIFQRRATKCCSHAVLY